MVKNIFLFVFFLIGFIFGVINPILWIILFILYKKKDKGYPVLNRNFVFRVSVYGFLVFLVIFGFLII